MRAFWQCVVKGRGVLLREVRLLLKIPPHLLVQDYDTELVQDPLTIKVQRVFSVGKVLC